MKATTSQQQAAEAEGAELSKLRKAVSDANKHLEEMRRKVVHPHLIITLHHPVSLSSIIIKLNYVLYSSFNSLMSIEINNLEVDSVAGGV